MRIRIPEGTTEIDFKFRTFGSDLGKAVSLVGLGATAIYLVIAYIADRRAIIKK
jgi:hypothetical protein